ncbi:MAG: rod shape-determining protein RodA [Alistipes sp.]|nr:rod shape-determining protein RodA [Alistipes sp.]
MTGSKTDNGLGTGYLDWWALAIYFALVIIGWVNIYAAVYTETQSAIFDLGQRYGMQLIWIGISLAVGVVILLLDDKYWHILAYPMYGLAILLLLAVFVLGREIKGAYAWIVIGPVALQPAEFVKFTTSLALARYMSRYSFNIHRFSDLWRVFAIIFLPAAIIVLQNDTGSALVYGALLLVLYREGLNPWIFVALIMAATLFIAAFLFTPATILVLLVLGCAVAEGLVNGNWRSKAIYLSSVALCTLLIYFISAFLLPGNPSVFWSLLTSVILTLVLVIIYAYRYRLRNVYFYIALCLASVAFVSTVDYVFDNVMQIHQQKRILDLLGLESDTQNWGYNVNQSKIAIGSGGLFGKGFLESTQTRFDFVPEQSTDFIFCTVGEEWGFVGTTFVTALFCLLILRLMKMGERQREPFGRIYCYCAAAIFFAHVVVNIGMTIGIMPVIGIPLPFFSYGGSSFLAFSILFFVAVRLDAGKRELMRAG